jgi:hypothetical protein
VVVGVALALAVFALPSALNLPQANPSQVLEYAPVPGNANQAPPGGNIAGLGLGQGGDSSLGPGGGLPPGEPPPLPQLGPLMSGTPSQYACVGNPPRQTEDPLAPPCVAFFRGDNGGATYTGVDPKEIRILFHFDGGGADIDNMPVPADGMHDLALPPQAGEYPDLTFLRNWMRFFNARFQTYGRKAHFYAFFNDLSNNPQNRPTAERMRADAANNFQAVHPFGVMAVRSRGFATVYLEEMNRQGVVSFGSTQGVRTASSYGRFPGLQWDFRPPTDLVARQFSSFICAQVAPYDVSFSGDPAAKGRRVYGLLYGVSPAHPEETEMAKQFESQVATSCGVSFVRKHGLKYTDAIFPEDTGADSQQAIADFRAAGVTTIIWPGGWNINPPRAATAIGWVPEWLAADDWNQFDTQTIGSLTDQTQWAHAGVVSPITLNNHNGLPAESRCVDAYTTVDPSITQNPTHLAFACRFYNSLLMMFTGIQVAGPRLTPSSLDKGFHAIPAHPSSSPAVPACYFDPGDYTCEKDAIVEFWDPSAVNPSGGSGGCYRMADNGARRRAGEWPRVGTRGMRPSDVCNLYSGRD